MKNSIKIKEILRFLVGGGSAVIIDFSVYIMLIYLGVEVSLAKAISYILGAFVGFIINKFWTFESMKLRADEVIKYIILYAFSALLNTIVNAAVLKLFAIKLFAFLCATGMSTVCNFIGQKFFVFTKKN